MLWVGSGLVDNFIHTSPKGGDDGRDRMIVVAVDISIHTSPKGGDHDTRRPPTYRNYFNPHLPEGR